MYDIVIIGAGVSSIFTMLKLDDKQKILAIDSGPSIEERLEKPSASGFGGLGLSEGKYNFSPYLGSNLSSKIGDKLVRKQLAEVEEIINTFGGQSALKYQSDADSHLSREGDSPIHFLDCPTKHLGTKLSKEVYTNIFAHLSNRIEFLFNNAVTNLEKTDDTFRITTSENHVFYSKKVIIATGSKKNPSLDNSLAELGLAYQKKRIDIGFRIETLSETLDPILQNNLEVKMRSGHLYSYCMNKFGRVIKRNLHGRVTPDGQNCREDKPSNNLNFTLFRPYHFDNEAQMNAYLDPLFHKINQDRGRIIGYPLHSLSSEFKPRKKIEGTLPYESDFAADIILDDLLKETIAFFHCLEQVSQSKIDGNTLLYCYDTKELGPEIHTDISFESDVPNLFFIGDCSGVTHSLSHAACSGLYLGKALRD
ncbi:FAD dependent oxidoreductase [Listeria grandensis FSL F6-0971]|uniref:FAD dependent oxidoreductase n=1 Tax=Listeria grandensis FSL F6-0971 TaxID=1265819 RepID=W7BDH4_9LIST|nr:NAD(P)/FAD-dependent oxidoreductase [Listeria grandensis]EUJ23992.1 FAD dependent oxidoreductase [Listeria grandensis FSL F6-0971]